MVKAPSYAIVKGLEVLVVIHHLAIVNGDVLSQVFLDQLGVHRMKCVCLCLDRLALDLA
jgi:hypothetical protein